MMINKKNHYKWKAVQVLIIMMLVPVFIIFASIPVFAHPGKTDANGGHYDHSTEEYHYHHGLHAHQHNADGTCPLDENYEPGVYYYSEKYKPQSKPKTKSESKSKATKRSFTTKMINDDSLIDEGTIPVLLVMAAAVLLLGLEFFGDALFPARQSANSGSTESNSKTYYCPYCGAPMVLRTSKYGPFYGCSNYPACKGTRNLNGKSNRRKRKKNR